ncbi:MAG: hypothetical protein HOP11_00265 [Saprospiraceae bacterium]|nr:hypothetical protein [Saprospiraceae bacterium]
MISELIFEREKLLLQFQSLQIDSLNHYSLHPRLKEKIRPVDLLFFIGEHDDHHLTTIIEIKKKLVNANS